MSSFSYLPLQWFIQYNWLCTEHNSIPRIRFKNPQAWSKINTKEQKHANKIPLEKEKFQKFFFAQIEISQQMPKLNINHKLGSGCGSTDRMAASDIRGPQFYSYQNSIASLKIFETNLI